MDPIRIDAISNKTGLQIGADSRLETAILADPDHMILRTSFGKTMVIETRQPRSGMQMSRALAAASHQQNDAITISNRVRSAINKNPEHPVLQRQATRDTEALPSALAALLMMRDTPFTIKDQMISQERCGLMDGIISIYRSAEEPDKIQLRLSGSVQPPSQITETLIWTCAAPEAARSKKVYALNAKQALDALFGSEASNIHKNIQEYLHQNGLHNKNGVKYTITTEAHHEAMHEGMQDLLKHGFELRTFNREPALQLINDYLAQSLIELQRKPTFS